MWQVWYETRDCPQKKPPGETPARVAVSAVHSPRTTDDSEETLAEKCRRFREELESAELVRVQSGGRNRTVVLCLCRSGGCTWRPHRPRLIWYNLIFSYSSRWGDRPEFQALLLESQITPSIPIGAQVDLTFSWQGKTVKAPVYIRSDVGRGGEPCLLGTNVVMPLGLMTPAPGVEPEDVRDSLPVSSWYRE